MTLEQQVVSLELAQKLKKLGVKQESLFYWYHLYVAGAGEGDEINYGIPPEQKNITNVCSAFTVAELGEMLPDEIDAKYPWRFGESREISTGGDTHSCYYSFDSGLTSYEQLHWVGANTEADARAKMLVYLIENKLITL